MAYPQRLLSPGEEVIADFRPHWSRILKEILLTVGVAVVLVLLAALFDFENSGWVMLGIAVVWFLLVLGGLLNWYFTQHVITDERVIYRAGVLSRHGKEIPLEVINDVAFNQRFLERIIGSGDLLIESAGEYGQSRYKDIPHPEEMQVVIYQAREARQVELEGGARVPPTTAHQLHILSELHEAGKLTDAEFESQKAKLLGTEPAT